MPCHNGAAYISDAIQSVQKQTFNDWELIIINDCSTDLSAKIINEFISSDKRIKYLITQISTGYPSDVRNIGIENASGRYIAFLDCDDLWKPSKLEKQIPLFDNQNVAVVFSWYLKMDKDGNQHNKIIKSPTTVNFKKLLNGNVIGNLTGIYDTQKVGKVFQKHIHHEDYLMWLEILKKGFIAKNTKSTEAIYREYKKSLSGSKLKVIGWTWNIFYNELNLSLIFSVIYFFKYIIKGFLKFIK